MDGWKHKEGCCFFSFNLTGIPDFILFLVKLTAASEQHRIFIAVMFHYSFISVFHPGFCSKNWTGALKSWEKKNVFETAWDNVCWRVNISPVFTEKHGRNTTSSPQQTLEINNLYLDPRLFGVIVVILRKHLGRIIDQIFFLSKQIYLLQ